MRYCIYDLVCSIPEFEICGYKFIRECDYDSKIVNLPRNSVITEDRETGNWVETETERPGIHQHTYTAFWEGSEPEPQSKIHLNGSLMLDILLLWSLWSNVCPRTGERALYHQVVYHNDKFFTNDKLLIRAIELSLRSITDKTDAKTKKLFPALFLIQQSNLTDTWQYKTLLLSPCIDLVSKSISCIQSDIFNSEEITAIESFKKEVKQFINEKNFTENVSRNAIGPFISKVNTVGTPTAVDQLYKWVKWTLDIDNTSDEQALYDHCIAFNQFRNSVVHYAGLPNRDIKIRLCNGKLITVSKSIDEDVCIRTGIYYFFVFREIIQIWIAKRFNIHLESTFSISKAEVMQFIREGIWREENIFENGFILTEGTKTD